MEPDGTAGTTRGTDQGGVGAWTLAGAICGFVFAAAAHMIGVPPTPLSPTTDEVRALFDTSPLLGYVVYVVAGGVLGAGWGVIKSVSG